MINSQWKKPYTFRVSLWSVKWCCSLAIFCIQTYTAALSVSDFKQRSWHKHLLREKKIYIYLPTFETIRQMMLELIHYIYTNIYFYSYRFLFIFWFMYVMNVFFKIFSLILNMKTKFITDISWHNLVQSILKWHFFKIKYRN